MKTKTIYAIILSTLLLLTIVIATTINEYGVIGEDGNYTSINADTVNTGQGNNELYAMNQNVRTSDGVEFDSVNNFKYINNDSTVNEINTYFNNYDNIIFESGIYNIDESLLPNTNNNILAYGAIFNRSSSLTKPMINFSNNNVVFSGGVFEMNNLGGGVSDNINGVLVYANDILLNDITVQNGDGSSLFNIDGNDDKVLERVKLNNVKAINNSFSHGIRMYGAELTITNSLVKNMSQDGYRSYGTDTLFKIYNSYAEDSRTCYSSWDAGDINNIVENSVANNCTDAFKATGGHTNFVGVSAFYSKNTSLFLRGDGVSIITGMNIYNNNGSKNAVLIESDNNIITGLYSHYSSTDVGDYGINISGDNNFISGYKYKNANNPYLDTGSDNSILSDENTKLNHVSSVQFDDSDTLIFGNSGLSDAYMAYSSSDFLRLYVKSSEIYRAYEDRFQFQLKARMSDNNWLEFGNSGQGTDGAIRWNSANSKLDFNIGNITTNRFSSTGNEILGNLNVTGNVTASYKSSDGTSGFTGSCADGTSLTVKDGLITGCS